VAISLGFRHWSRRLRHRAKVFFGARRDRLKAETRAALEEALEHDASLRGALDDAERRYEAYVKASNTVSRSS